MILTEWNTEDAIAFAREEGRETGHEEGREEGREERNLEIARKMKEAGISPEIIFQTTGLNPVDE